MRFHLRWHCHIKSYKKRSSIPPPLVPNISLHRKYHLYIKKVLNIQKVLLHSNKYLKKNLTS